MRIRALEKVLFVFVIVSEGAFAFGVQLSRNGTESWRNEG